MQVFFTLVRREVGGYFTSFTGYTVMAVVLLLIGINLIWSIEYVNGTPSPVPITQLFYQSLMFWFILLFATPVITMRSFAMEKDSGTFETLMTAPVSDREVVWAKFLGSLIFYVLIWSPLLPCMLVLRDLGGVSEAFDYGILASTALGIFLYGCVYISMGLFASSLTRSQVTAAMVAFAIGASLFMLSFVGATGSGVSGTAQRLVELVNLREFMLDFAGGVVDSRPVVFCVTLTALFLFLTMRVIESRRWK